MKCPTCVEKEKRSKVFIGLSTTTLVMPVQYYDEDGNYQSANPNTTTTHYTCSNGHDWIEKS